MHDREDELRAVERVLRLCFRILSRRRTGPRRRLQETLAVDHGGPIVGRYS
jgi:hypothetical protein